MLERSEKIGDTTPKREMSLVETHITVDTNQAWTRAQKRTVRDVVSDAVDLATIGLLEFGFESTLPSKTVRVRKVSMNHPSAGEANSALNLDVHIPVDYVHRNKLARVANTIPVVVFHELIHCLRFERFPDTTLGEIAASEGLAYVLDDRFQSQILLPNDRVPLDVALPHSRENMQIAQSFKQNLDEHGTMDIDTDNLHEHYALAWHGDRVIAGFTAIEFTGIMAVREALIQGAVPADIMVSEPSVILSVLDT